MPIPMTRPDPLTGADPSHRARLLDDDDVDQLIAQAHGEDDLVPDDDEDEEDETEGDDEDGEQ